MKCPHCKGTGVVPDWQKLGRRLRRERVKAGISLRKYAKSCGMSAPHLCDMELGRRSMGGPKGQLALSKLGLGDY